MVKPLPASPHLRCQPLWCNPLCAVGHLCGHVYAETVTSRNEKLAKREPKKSCTSPHSGSGLWRRKKLASTQPQAPSIERARKHIQ